MLKDLFHTQGPTKKYYDNENKHLMAMKHFTFNNYRKIFVFVFDCEYQITISTSSLINVGRTLRFQESCVKEIHCSASIKCICYSGSITFYNYALSVVRVVSYVCVVCVV